ncbi:MAG: prepilin-type N-terminal cleavage/methylation domain-containing protein [Cyanobacteria bacterium]|nr:prepilin-type N-terminal cleavage/methylation domain-containing protein [Cyanobacteriota bacterium]
MLSPASLRKFEGGFTLIEMIVVTAIVIVGSIITIPMTINMVRNSKGDSSVEMTKTFLETARNRAVAERRNFVLTVNSDTQLQVERVEVPSGLLTVVDILTLEGDQSFYRTPGMADTPDAFGGADEINFTGPMPVMFTSDGSLIDSAGDVTNGTIWIGNEDTPETQRAVTVWGVTGMIRAWKWRGSEWLQ